MNYNNDDALDQALFSLQLEEPPVDLRASILATTVYRPAPMFSFNEIIAICGLTVAVAVLIGYVIGSGGSLFAHSVSAIEVFLNRSLSSYATLGWLAAGGATAIWLSLFTGFQSFATVASKVGRTPRR